jgi:hypothetical protein
MATLRELCSADRLDMEAIEKYLDGLDARMRVEEVRSLGRREQRRLFDAADGYRPVRVEDIVPPETPSTREVVHHGKNSLPLFTRFAKVFCRSEGNGGGELYGYNRNSSFLETVVGPGYFVARDNDRDGEVLIDYLRTPPARPIDGWPQVLPNHARLSRFVYNGTQDVLRGVSRHVSIGRAYKKGKPMGAWFVLCRER